MDAELKSCIKELKNNGIISLREDIKIEEIYFKLKEIDTNNLTARQLEIYKQELENIAEILFIRESKCWNKPGMDLGLDRIKLLLRYLGNPQKDLSVIHVAGTNGKGSVCNYLQCALRAGGYKVGVYSSPNITGHNDGVRINEENISFFDLYENLILVKNTWESNYQGNDYITLFEASTVAAILYFKNKKVDYAIIEVGLGGRNDATNVFNNKLLSIITSISKDHTGILGDTIEEIAFEKAGIIQDNDNVIVYPSGEEVTKVIEKVCQKRKATFNLLNINDIDTGGEVSNNIFSYRDYNNIELAMPGKHQVLNASLALLALDNLLVRNIISLSNEEIKNGFKKAKLPGRLEEVCDSPKIVIDGAHNDNAVEYLVEYIESLSFNKLKIVVGVLKDKSHKSMFEKLAKLNAEFYLTEVPFEERKMNTEEMKKELGRYTDNIKCYDNPEVAIEKAIADYKKGDLILVTGSLYLISKVRKYLVNKT